MKFSPAPRILAPAAAAWALLVPPGAGAEEVGFNEHIRPILSDRCFTCHGFDANTREADLRLDTAEGAYAAREDGSAAIVPGDPEASLLWQRIISDDPDEVMPPPDFLRQLGAEDKALLKRWIEQGAEYEPHWTFVPVEKPETDPGGGHPVDQLVTARLEEEGLGLSPRAGRRTLVRRLSFDLRGLPPSPGEVEAFVADDSPDAWEKLVDRFLADPAFGERMAWPWLEAARYADSNGFQHDAERTMWPWRDWVIGAFNRNLPYDDFTVWQIAGDLLPDATFEQKLATGFLRNHAINGEGGSIPEENRVNYVMDMTETVGTVWMALTFNCARCHDHKYDPLSQEEYYALTAFFNQSPLSGAEKSAQSAPVLAVPDKDQADREQTLVREQAELRKQLPPDPKTLQALKTLPEKRSAEQKQLIAAAGLPASPDPEALAAKDNALDRQLAELRKAIPQVMVMADRKEKRPTHILAVGSYESPGREVQAGTPAVLPPLTADGPADRLDLARWLVSRDHPLTARVTVNRLWQDFFGIGLVKSPEDFGVQSELPIHPQLLDWLAADFMDHGWDFKHLVRTIVTSDTYRQSSAVTPALLERDPKNRLLARGPRFRLPSWMIRDQAIALGGRLVDRVGGEPVKPWQPPGLWAEVTFGGGKKHYVPDTGEKLRRRSIYTFWRRISAPPMFFDTAKRETCEVGTLRTNSPLHALSILNDPHYATAARALASRAVEDASAEPEEALAAAFARILCRPPGPEEAAVLREQFAFAHAHFTASPDEAEAFLSIGDAPHHPDLDAPTHAALATVCLSLLNTDEALTKE